MKREEQWESASLKWIHELRESQYHATRHVPLKTWVKPVDAETAARACRRMGLKVRIGEGARRQTSPPRLPSGRGRPRRRASPTGAKRRG